MIKMFHNEILPGRIIRTIYDGHTSTCDVIDNDLNSVFLGQDWTDCFDWINRYAAKFSQVERTESNAK